MPTKKAPASSHLKSFSYVASSRALTVHFKGGNKSYTYPDVPRSVYTAMTKASHPGHVLFEKVLKQIP